MKIGNMQTLPWYARMMIFAVVAGAVYGGFYYFVTRGTRAETKEIQDQVSQLKQQNASAQIAEQRLNEFRAAYKARQQEYDDLKALLPEQRELTSVLQGLQDRARSSNLSLRRFSPKEDQQQEYYSGKPIEIEVTSSFSNLRTFYDEMAKYQRIVSISDFKINRLNDQDLTQNLNKTLDAQFTMTAYYVSPNGAAQPGDATKKPATPSQPAK